MQQMDVSGLPTEAELMKPGTKDGQVKIFNVSGKAMVYRWSQADMKWVLVGEAMGRGYDMMLYYHQQMPLPLPPLPTPHLSRGKPKPKKTELDGQFYDHVTKVFITEQQSVMLGWNIDDDPRDVVDHFAALYSLTEDLKYQVYQFVAPKTDPQATRHVPSWTKHGFKLFADTSKLAPMRKRLAKSIESDSSFSANAFKVLMANMENVSKYHSSAFSQEEAGLVKKMLVWKGTKIPPLLDAFRILMLEKAPKRTIFTAFLLRRIILQKIAEERGLQHPGGF
eukprot:jgi/Bigna1/68990/fgenesh1_pg.7_\